MIRQDYRINKMFLPFSRSAGQAAERQNKIPCSRLQGILFEDRPGGY